VTAGHRSNPYAHGHKAVQKRPVSGSLRLSVNSVVVHPPHGRWVTDLRWSRSRSTVTWPTPLYARSSVDVMAKRPRSRVTDARSIPAPLRPGDYRISLPFDGRTRTFVIHVPPQAADGSPLPVVVNFHGAGSNASQQRSYSGMDVTANRHGFVVVYPNGTGIIPEQRRLLTFNAGGCCPPATRNDVDDVGFTEAILSVLQHKITVDTQRLYATGMSNGGMMAHRMAIESPRIAAVASVAGQLNVTSFRPSRPVSVMEFHSVDDRHARYDGGQGSRFGGTRARKQHPSVQAGIDRWVTHNGCPATPLIGQTLTGALGTFDEGQTVTKITYGPGREGVEVVLYRMTGAGHVWPGSPTSLPLLIGRATALVDANEVMWEFFAAHPLP
jgi:polyhydroxybutyrate depolymerase